MRSPQVNRSLLYDDAWNLASISLCKGLIDQKLLRPPSGESSLFHFPTSWSELCLAGNEMAKQKFHSTKAQQGGLFATPF
jgi:hypothetical protein